MHNTSLIQQAKALRSQGYTFMEIQKELKQSFSKGTLSYWCKGVELPSDHRGKIRCLNLAGLAKGRKMSALTYYKRRTARDNEMRLKNEGAVKLLDEPNVAKLALAILYWAEGGKNRNASLQFCNSDAYMIRMFLYLLRMCYTVRTDRIRITVQCRADQNIKDLEEYWSEVTNLALDRFYPTKVDKRTIGIATKKLDYKGVCRVDYYSADTYHEMMVIISMMQKFGPIA